jgi:hypothetical protein
MGSWKDTGSILLSTAPDAYPCWSLGDATLLIKINEEDLIDSSIFEQNIEYKYLVKNKVSLFFV